MSDVGIHVGDIGTVIKVLIQDQDEAVVDVSSATVTKNILIYPPAHSANTLLTKAASFSTDGTDGYIQYAGESGVFDVAGDYWFQGSVVITAGTFKSTKVKRTVYGNL